MNLTADIKTRLKKFFDSYRKKANFLRSLEKKHKMPDEIILLACCYLDQLGNCLYSKAGSNKRSLEQLLFEHSGKRDEFNLISVSNLAIDLFRFAEFAYIKIEKPGRIILFSNEEKTLMQFIDQTGISLTSKMVYRFLTSIYRSLKANFRIHPYQTSKKDSFGNMDEIVNAIITDSKIKKLAPDLNENKNILKNLLNEYTYASILYKDYRCKAVHEVEGISINLANFWRKKQPYFSPLRFMFCRNSFYTLEFPSFFLLEVLSTCIDCVEKSIIGKGKLPIRIFDEICDIDEFDIADLETMEEEKPIKLRIE